MEHDYSGLDLVCNFKLGEVREQVSAITYLIHF